MRFSIAILAVFSVFYLATSVPAIIVPAGESGVVYNCAYPFTVTLDGSFVDWPDVTWEKVDSTMGWSPFPSSDADGSLEFACVADNDYLYVGILVKDDMKVVGENVGGDVWQDDSAELYIDGGNEKAAAYDANDAQITIGRDNVGGDINKPKMGGSGPGSATKAAVVDTSDGYAIEAAVKLADFGIKAGDEKVIGFNVQLNDDDDKGARDHKLAWSKVELATGEGSWNNPQMFAELKFVLADLTAVSSNGKLATIWSSLKK